MSKQQNGEGFVHWTTPEELADPENDLSRANNYAAKHLSLLETAEGAEGTASQALATANSYAGQIAQANTTAGQAVAIATDAKGTAEAIEGPISTRLGYLETREGLAPGDVYDVETASVLAQEDSESNAVLNAQTVQYMRRRDSSLAEYGPLGTSDDSTTIAAALADNDGRTLVFPPGAVLNSSGNSITDRTNAVIKGNGAVLNLTTPGATGLRIDGTLTDVTVDNLGVTGSGVVADDQNGIAIPSGVIARNLTVKNCSVSKVLVGIDITANNIFGSLHGVNIIFNEVEDAIGTNPGQGYGIHTSGPHSDTDEHDIFIGFNRITRAQRHSIYQGMGNAVTLLSNRIYEHRSGQIGSGATRPAIMLARAASGLVMGNRVHGFAGGGMMIGAISESGLVNGPTMVQGNFLLDSLDNIALVTIGGDESGDLGVTRHLDFTGNTLRGGSGANLFSFRKAVGARIAGNRLIKTDTSGQAFSIGSADILPGSSDFLDSVVFEDNDMFLGDNVDAFRLTSAAAASAARLSFSRNRLHTGRNMFALSSPASNPNITVLDQPQSGLSLTSGVGTTAPYLNGPVEGAGGVPMPTPTGYLSVNIGGTIRKIPYVT